jgi:selT/selW/selH-like putative selenoprotein
LHASRVEAELKADYPDSKVELIKGSGGIFDVKCDGKLIFSKQNIRGQRFPDKGEIVQLIIKMK